jgi:hypothetical protein
MYCSSPDELFATQDSSGHENFKCFTNMRALSCAPCGMAWCFGLNRKLLIVKSTLARPNTSSPASSQLATTSPDHTLCSTVAVPPQETIMSAMWISLYRKQQKYADGSERVFEDHFDRHQLIVIGTSCGFIQLHDIQGRPVHRQWVHASAIVSMHKTSVSNSRTYITLTAADAVCVLDLDNIAKHLMKIQSSPPSVLMHENRISSEPIAIQKFNMPGRTRPRQDAAVIPILPRIMHTFQDLDAHCDIELGILTVGSGPAVSRLWCLEENGSDLQFGNSGKSDDNGVIRAAWNALNQMVGCIMSNSVDAIAHALNSSQPGVTSHTAVFDSVIAGTHFVQHCQSTYA